MPSPLHTPESQSRRPIVARRRMDLRAVVTLHPHDTAVVVKDPIAMKYHRMRPDEYFLLERLDGATSLDELKEAYEDRFLPQKVSIVELNQLLFRFHQSGLTISDAISQGDRLTDRRRKEKRQRLWQHLSGVLFIRFPGVDPEPLLKRIYPIMRPFLHPLSLALMMVVCLISLVVFGLHWDRFANEFPRMQQWLRFESVLLLAVVIGGTKVLHELGHAVVCKHFGGECHQIGPMLLVFTPALYCDTSDSWMLPNRFERAAVGIAGIATEVVLAAAATLIWVSTGPGVLHSLSMNVMLVCGVSTVLFNANPLLRYDGYYVLSDLCDMPNLGQRSQNMLTAIASKFLFGVHNEVNAPLSRTATLGMLFYASAAFVYRWILTLMIVWIVSLILRPYRLESIGHILCVIAVGGLGYATLRGPFQFLQNPAQRRKIKMKRAILSGIVFATIFACCFIPLPNGVSTPAKIVPRKETPVYIVSRGQLMELHRTVGDRVEKGDELATLENFQTQYQYLTANARFEKQKSIVETIKLVQLNHPEAGNDLPSQTAILEDLHHQLQTKKRRVAGLAIAAPASGILIPAPRHNEDVAANSEFRLVNWTGYVTDDANRQCFLEPGDELMSIIEDERWNAEITLPQSQVQHIQVGNQVTLVLESSPAKKWRGRVSDISLVEWHESRDTDRRDDPRAARQASPPMTSYLVRVEMEDQNEIPTITSLAASARIEALPSSIANRVGRFLSSLLRFR